ncbi:MAG: hypothetical protein GKS03_13580 [Alphaproteobacteria bacterium]|nr:hypothetical protein [Alphaproteobacteria bacterium]
MKIPIVSSFFSRLRPRAQRGPGHDDITDSDNPKAWDDDGLELKLGTLLADKASKSYGTVQAITLTEFQDDLGKLWKSHEKNILLIAETTIDRMINKGHTAIREDELTWLLVTPDLSIGEAEKFAKIIAESIGEKLMGARFDPDEDPDPTPTTGMVDLSDALAEDGSIDRSAMQQAVAKARAVIAAKDGKTRRNRKKTIDSKVDNKKREVGTPADDNRTRHTGVTSAEAGIKLVYWPMWASDSQSIDTFVCRAICEDGESPFERQDPSQVAANAVAVARAGIVALNGMIKDGVRAKFVLPLPLAPLLAPAQRQILQALEKLEDAHRFLYLRTEIVAIPRSVSTASILTARDLLLPVARDVSVVTSLMSPNNAVLAASKVMIGCDAGAAPLINTEKIAEELHHFKKALKKRPTYVLGLPDADTVKAAVSNNYAEIGGPGLHSVLGRRPHSTVAVTTQDLLAGTPIIL